MVEQKTDSLGYLLFMSALLVAVLLATGWFLFAYSDAPDKIALRNASSLKIGAGTKALARILIIGPSSAIAGVYQRSNLPEQLRLLFLASQCLCIRLLGAKEGMRPS